MNRHYRQLYLIATSLLLCACASVATLPGKRIASNSGAIATNVSDCQSLLGRPNVETPDSLDTSSIGLLSWNMKKGSKDLWEQDLREMAAGREFLILQEAVLDGEIEDQLDGLWHSSFSQGFTTRSRTTGVATYSRSEPLSECSLSVVEPWLRTRKATSITEFGLAGREETLVVVNVHVVNISIGLVRFRDQIEQIRQVLAAHDGPAILSGDFNTWRRKRLDIVNELAGDLAFSPVQLDGDYRKTFNGYALDHVFVRGLFVDSSESKPVTSSDHNPIAVELRL